MKEYLLVGLVGLILVVSVFQSFQINSMKEKIISGSYVSSGGIDMTGWSENDKMMYEHHGILPQGSQSAQSSQPGRVGGC